jgi:capsular exopolysaccharide synthesis family protein
MHKIFNLPNERGLAELLTEELTDDNTASLIRETNIPGLHVLTCGNAVNSTAAHLLHSPNLSAFINRAKQDYDMILFDSPPMIHLTDARVIARLCDATILVVNAGRTTRDALLVAKERFQEDHTRLLGTILNNWDPKQQKSSYYYSQYRKYTSSYLPTGEEGAT